MCDRKTGRKGKRGKKRKKKREQLGNGEGAVFSKKHCRYLTVHGI